MASLRLKFSEELLVLTEASCLHCLLATAICGLIKVGNLQIFQSIGVLGVVFLVSLVDIELCENVF
jgi:hypothetical protein